MEEISGDVEQIVRAAAATVGRMVEVAQRRQAQIEREGRDAAIASQRDSEERFKGWVRERQEAYRRVGWHDWEDQATPAQWADAYATARAMREVDPTAVFAANRIEEQYQARYGVNLREAHDLWQTAAQQHREEGIDLQAGGPDAAPEKLIEQHRSHYTVITDPTWQQQAQATDWAAAYGHARVAYDADPVARMACTTIETETHKRYRLNLREVFDEELARRSADQLDEADDLVAQSHQEQQRAFEEREQAEHPNSDPTEKQHHEHQADLADGRAENLAAASEQASHMSQGAVVEGIVLDAEQRQAHQVYTTAGKAVVPMNQAMQQAQKNPNQAGKPARGRQHKQRRSQKDLTR